MTPEQSDRRVAYAEKLKDPRWQRRRLEILQRDEWKCQICGCADRTLHVHHRVYEAGKEPWEAKDDALVTLCDECHQEETDRAREAERFLIEQMKKAGCFSSHFERLGMAFGQMPHAVYFDDRVIGVIMEVLLDSRVRDELLARHCCADSAEDGDDA